MPLFVDCSDYEIRLGRLILATLNQGWAIHPNVTGDESNCYLRRAQHAFKSVDVHQDKDRNCKSQILPLLPVDLTAIEEI